MFGLISSFSSLLILPIINYIILSIIPTSFSSFQVVLFSKIAPSRNCRAPDFK